MQPFPLQHLLWSVAFIALVIALPALYVTFMKYVVAPIRLRKHTIPATPQLEPVEFADVPSDVLSSMSATAAQLARCGFKAVAHLRDAGQQQPGSSGYVSIWGRECGDAWAVIIFVRCDHPSGVRSDTHTVTFATEFEGDTAIATSNWSSPSTMPPDPRGEVVRWRGMEDVAMLWTLHERRVLRRQGNRRLRQIVDLVGYMLENERRVRQRCVDGGYYWLDADHAVYRKTFKGCLQTYRLLWPWLDLLEARMDRELRAELEACGMGRPERYAMQPRVDADDAARPLPYLEGLP